MRGTRLLTVRELAAAFSLHPQTVYRWKRKGRLPFVSLAGRVRFDASEVERFIEERRTRPLPLLPPKIDVDFSLADYDRLFLEGGTKALSKDSRRWNYGIGSVSVRKTKKGHDRWYLDYRSKEG